jgi:hypothetical protein
MMKSAKIPGAFDADPEIKRDKQLLKEYEIMMELKNPPEAFKIGVYDRGQSLRKIMAGIPEKDRGWLMTVVVNCISNEIDFIDGVIVIIILWKIRIVDQKYPEVYFKEHSLIEKRLWRYRLDV